MLCIVQRARHEYKFTTYYEGVTNLLQNSTKTWHKETRNVLGNEIQFSFGVVSTCMIPFIVFLLCRLSPEIFLKRPVVEGNRWRLDCILKRKAVGPCSFISLLNWCHAHNFTLMWSIQWRIHFNRKAHRFLWNWNIRHTQKWMSRASKKPHNILCSI